MTPLPVRDLLAVHGAARQRVTDDHMFTVAHDGYPNGTFRLQLFTAHGARPVAVATQLPGEGTSLINGAEEYAADVWRRHFPQLAEPPVWIQLLLSPDDIPPLERLNLVTFTQVQPYELADPDWWRITPGDLARLVGAEVDRSRGQGYAPRPRVPEPQPVYRVTWVALLPRPAGMNRGCFTGAVSRLQSLGRQLTPRRGTRDCCYYHSIDWHQVSTAAIRIARQARRERLAREAFAERAVELAYACDLPAAQREALTELLAAETGIQIDRDQRGRGFYINGRHRTTAMLDTGVRRTVIIRWETPDATPPQVSSGRANHPRRDAGTPVPP